MGAFCSLRFNSPQNYLGFCFNMSGRVNCMCALLCLHYCTKSFSASTACACSLPLCLIAVRYLARAALHCAVNHGAICLAHLFGFFLVRLVDTSTTPAAIASSIRNVSIYAERSSLLCSLLVVMVVNAVANFCVDMCAVHCAALLPYSFRHVPSFQR